MAAFETGAYRNLFAELGYPQAEIDRRIQEIWDAIFGDGPLSVYQEVGEDMGFVTDTGNNDVRTEGQSYAMLMAVLYDNKEVFDRVWKWTKEYMYMDEGDNAGYFAWSVGLDGAKNAYGPAPDGENFFAIALLFAHNRWGSGEGAYDYQKHAKKLLHDVLYNPQPMWNPENKLIKFVPSMEITDPSYHTPHFFELFALWGNEEDKQFWLDAAKASRDYLVTACHPTTGLNPEYSHYDGRPHVGLRHHHLFYSDAYRTALNIALDTIWFGEQPELIKAVRNQQEFLKREDWDDIFEVDGTKPTIEELKQLNLDEKVLHPVGLIATTAAGSLATGDEEWVRRFWETPLRSGDRRYYDNKLYAFSFLALAGKYQIVK